MKTSDSASGITLYKIEHGIPMPPKVWGRGQGWNKMSECDILTQMKAGDSVVIPRGSLAMTFAVSRALGIDIRSVVSDSKLGASMNLPERTVRVWVLEKGSYQYAKINQKTINQICSYKQRRGVINLLEQKFGIPRRLIMAIRCGKITAGHRYRTNWRTP